MINIIRYDEVVGASKLIKSVFDEFIAEDYSAEGVLNFYKRISGLSISERAKSGSFICVFKQDNEIIGYIELSGINHIYLLFVKKDCHSRGIARQLINSVIIRIQGNNPFVKDITVNSTFNSLSFYEKIGFEKIADFQYKNGITNFPMRLVID